MLSLGLNERERARYAEMFKSIAEQAEKLQHKLESGTEDDITLEFLMFSLIMASASEFQKLILGAAKTAKSAPEFPDTIPG